MKYKFIGTEQDLIDCGYVADMIGVDIIQLNDDNGFGACKIINKDDKTYCVSIYRIMCDIDNVLEDLPIEVSICDLLVDVNKQLTNCVKVDDIKPYIQDLIDKGLVVEE